MGENLYLSCDFNKAAQDFSAGKDIVVDIIGHTLSEEEIELYNNIDYDYFRMWVGDESLKGTVTGNCAVFAYDDIVGLLEGQEDVKSLYISFKTFSISETNRYSYINSYIYLPIQN